MTGRKFKLIVNAVPLTKIPTGVGRYLFCLYQHIEKFYKDELEIGYFDGTTICHRLPRGPKDLEQWIRMARFFWKLPTPLAFLYRIVSFLREEIIFRKFSSQYELYHEAAFFPFHTSPHMKTVFTIHDLSLLRYPNFHPRERIYFHRLLFEKRLPLVDHFLAVSHFTQKEIEKFLGITFRKISVAPLACEPQTFYPRSPEEMEKIRDEYKIPANYFLFVGTGDPRKNFQVIPKALGQTGKNLALVVVGWSGWQKRTDFSGNLFFLKYIPDETLAILYSNALALIFPSIYEGFGLPVLEAMACGCPVICSREASLPEVGGDAALYMNKPTDSNELISYLEEVATRSDLRHDMIRRGLKQAHRFSWELTARKTYEVFQKII
jgi:alpha-1,3-rhamnosyl/mannosyltransferase